MSADERDRQLKAAIQEHYRKHAGHVPAFGAIVGYTAVVMAGYRLDFGLPYDLEGDPAGPMQPVERLHEAALGTERWDFAADRAFPRYVDPDPDVNLIEADSKTLPEESRQFAPLNIPPEATGAAARRATKSPAEGFRPSG